MSGVSLSVYRDLLEDFSGRRVHSRRALEQMFAEIFVARMLGSEWYIPGLSAEIMLTVAERAGWVLEEPSGHYLLRIPSEHPERPLESSPRSRRSPLAGRQT